MFCEFKGMRQSLSELGEIILKVPQIVSSVNLDDPRRSKPLLEEFHRFVLDLQHVTEEADLRGSLLDIKLRLRLVANAQKKTQFALETRSMSSCIFTSSYLFPTSMMHRHTETHRDTQRHTHTHSMVMAMSTLDVSQTLNWRNAKRRFERGMK
jgi:hypothetical protein